MKSAVLLVVCAAPLLVPSPGAAATILPAFSVDPASPSVNGTLTPDDVLSPGPAVQMHGLSLGLQDDFFNGFFDNLDALSFGRDPLRGPIYFSVDRVAVGVAGTAVHAEAAPGVEEAHGDVFVSLPPAGTSVRFIDEETLGPLPGFFGDDLDALELDTLDRQFTYFSIDALSASNGFGASGRAGDILVSSGNGSFGVFAEGVTRMGLHSDDDLDGLILLDLGVRGQVDPGIDMALFSLSTFSPSAFTFTGNPYLPGVAGALSPADILFTTFTGGFALAFRAADVGLLPGDNLEALDTVAAAPEPAGLLTLGIGLLSVARWKRRRIWRPHHDAVPP
jgi:hypothetical protein